MKKFLLLSHYAPKPGFEYPEHDCPLAHRETAHKRIYSLDRYWSEGVLWETVEVENTTPETLMSLISDTTFDAVWLSGSPYLLSELEAHPWINHALQAAGNLRTQNQVPVIGICFGLQLLAHSAGGQVKAVGHYQRGEIEVRDEAGKLLVKTRTYHENYVDNLPPETKILGTSEQGWPYIVEFSGNVLGIQSHPECRLERALDSEVSAVFWKNLLHQYIPSQN